MSGQGAAIGAATGATYALATGKDPIKYAMIGGAVGGTGGAMMPTLGAGTAAGTAGGTTIAGTGSALTGAGASTAANTAFMAPAGVNSSALIGAGQGAGYTSAAVPSTIFSSPTLVNASQPLSSAAGQTAALERPLTYGMQGVEYGQGGSPTMMERFGQVGQYAQQTPVLTQMAAQSAQQALRQPQSQMAPAGQVSRGQIQPMDYMSLLNPQQSTVLRPQPISLLG